MIFLVGDRTFRITFSYSGERPDHTHCCVQLMAPEPGMTFLRQLILRQRGPDERDRDVLKTWEATATCNPKDTPNRRIGRKVALKHALKVAGINYDTRCGIWRQYLKATNDVQHRRGAVIRR